VRLTGKPRGLDVISSQRENASSREQPDFPREQRQQLFVLSGIRVGQLLSGRDARRYRYCRDFRISDTGVGFCGCCDRNGHPLQIALQKSVRDCLLFGPYITRARGMGVFLDLGVRVGPVKAR
jgi:hypothetical protein